MDKPKMITPFAIREADATNRLIFFWANATVAEPLREFGRLNKHESDNWCLSVDGRYNFNEVVVYLESLDTPLDAVWKDALTNTDEGGSANA